MVWCYEIILFIEVGTDLPLWSKTRQFNLIENEKQHQFVGKSNW